MKGFLCAGMLAASLIPIWAQDPPLADSDISVPSAPATVTQKWQFFKEETIGPFVLLAGSITAVVEQAARADPQYGVGGVALAKRFGASVGDNVSQNFFSDFLMASAFHEDTRYRRKGEGHRFWSRFGYAISRAVVARTDAGEPVVNWANLTGCGLQAGLSNAYYPPPSRNLSATAINWANSLAGSGFGNLFPEFLPDFKRWLKRHHL